MKEKPNHTIITQHPLTNPPQLPPMYPHPLQLFTNPLPSYINPHLYPLHPSTNPHLFLTQHPHQLPIQLQPRKILVPLDSTPSADK